MVFSLSLSFSFEMWWNVNTYFIFDMFPGIMMTHFFLDIHLF